MRVKITVLNDNTAGRYCLAEHGLSYIVEADEALLFDTGSSDLFLKNAQRLGIDLQQISKVVLSHGHEDHTGGMKFLSNKTVIAHPQLFMTRYRKSKGTSLGFAMTKTEAESKFTLHLTSEPYRINKSTWFLGEIPRITNFESKATPFVDEFGNDDFVPDDSGLAVSTPDGIVVISGCAHSGICNMVAHAQAITGEPRVYAVIGGFHLTENNEQTQKTIEWLTNQNVKKVIPSHCTAFAALCEFAKAFPFQQVKSGNVIVL